MGRYRQQYLYRCPHSGCRNAVVEPPALPAAAAIDWADLGARIGDRARPMRPATRARIAAGLARYARPITIEAAGHTYERRPGTRAWPADAAPLTAQTATATKALACPPLIVPAGGTWRDEPAPATIPFPARTTRENDGIAFPPFITVHRGRDNDIRTVPVTGPLTAVTASGNHLGLAVPDAAMIVRNVSSLGNPAWTATPPGEPLRTLTAAGHQSLVSWANLLVPYYGRSMTAQPVTVPAGTMATREHYGLATGTSAIDVDDVLFRMLKPPEIGRAMAFTDGYVVLGTQREKVRQYGNAVTPPVAEVLISALAEAITGEVLPG